MDLPISPIEPGAQIIDVAAVIKAVDPNGKLVHYHRYSEDCNDHELIGLLIVQLANLVKAQLDSFEPDEEG